MDTVAIETLAEWKFLVNSINEEPHKIGEDEVYLYSKRYRYVITPYQCTSIIEIVVYT